MTGTHSMFGAAVGESLSALASFPMRQSELVFGCIKPDFSWTSLKYSHSKGKSFHYVVQLMSELAQARPTTDRELRAYAGCLGVALHYVSDYFCRAHNDNQLRPTLAHFAYEYLLHQEACRTDLVTLSHYAARESQARPALSVSLLAEYTDALHEEYLTIPTSMNTDIRYAISASTMVAHSIVNMTQVSGKIRIAA